MARLLVKFGASANDKTGDSARTGAQKINTNFQEIYAFLGGDLTLPVAVPINKGGTGATTAEGARQALGLGEAALKGVGVGEGDIMTVGSYGFGTDYSPHVLAVEAKQPKDLKSGELAYYSEGEVSTITLATRTATTKGQLGMSQINSANPVLSVRGCGLDGSFSTWFEVFSEANATVAPNGTIKFAKNSARIDMASCMTQQGKSLEFTRASEGKYSILGCVLDKAQWTIEIPQDETGAPAYAVVLEQVGTVLNVTVTKDGKAYDVQPEFWFLIHLVV